MGYHFELITNTSAADDRYDTACEVIANVSPTRWNDFTAWLTSEALALELDIDHPVWTLALHYYNDPQVIRPYALPELRRTLTYFIQAGDDLAPFALLAAFRDAARIGAARHWSLQLA